MAQSFTTALTESRRKALLSGRPLSQQETAGIAEGYAADADSRAFNLKTAQTKDKALEQEEKLTMIKLKQEKELVEKQEDRLERNARRESQMTGAVGGATVGAKIGSAWGPVGTVVGGAIGGVIGLFGGSSHICTEVNRRIGISDENEHAIAELRAHAKAFNPKLLSYYVNTAGPAIVKSIEESHSDQELVDLYKAIENDLVVRISDLVRDGNFEDARRVYFDKTLELAEKYAPEHADKLRGLNNG